MSPDISIVVPTRNRSSLLGNLLKSLSELRGAGWEAIVIDDGSTDDTAETVQHWAARGLPLHYYHQPWGKMGSARNLGVAHAGAEFIAFTDDDCIVDREWAGALLTAFESHPEALGIQGKTITDRASMTPFTRQVEQLEGGQPYRTCNVAYRRAILEELGGFDRNLIRGEDVVMGMRVLERGPIVFAPEAVVLHPPRPKEWADRRAWRVLLESELHFRTTYPHYATSRSQTLSLQKAKHVLSRWVLLPIRRYGRWHCAYLRRHPLAYARHIPRMMLEKLALVSLLPFFLRRWRETAHRND
jgi:glycosyltransferase involved in cell wall biosynthesis